MEAMLKTCDLTLDQFGVLLGQMDRTDGAKRIWMEGPDGWALDWWQGVDASLVWCGAGREPIQASVHGCWRRSVAGRLFAPEGELRWRVIPGLGPACWRTVFLGLADWVGPVLADHSHCLRNLHVQRTHLFLWGRQTDSTPEEWIELRIPHRFRYPIENTKARNVRLLVEQWHDDSGEPHFVRWCDLVPDSETT